MRTEMMAGREFFSSNGGLGGKAFLMACYLFISANLTGCASWIVEEEQITLQHTQHQAVGVVLGSASVSIGVQVNDRRDYLAPGISRKWGKAVVGYGRNGLGEETYPDIIVTEPIEQTFKRSVEDELKARGFLISENAVRKVVIDINIFFNDYKVGFIRSDSVANLNMDVRVLSPEGSNLYSHQIAALGQTTWASTMSARDAKTALNIALDNGIDALFTDSAFISALLHN